MVKTKKTTERIIAKMSPEERKELLFYLKNPDFERMPCQTFTEFVDNPYYMGVGEDTYKKVKEEGDKIWQGLMSGELTEAVLLWGSGAGKSFGAAIITLQYVHYLLCMKNPHKYFGITDDKPIAVVNMGPTGRQAKDVIFASLKRFVGESPFFKEYEPDILATEIRFHKKNITLYCGNSQETMPLGMNIIFGNLDEAAWFLDTNDKSIAANIYGVMKNRITSRFGTRGFLMIVSTPRYWDDFITRLYRNSRELKYVYASQYKTWEVKDREKMSSETFEFVVARDRNGKPTEIWKDIPMDFKEAADRNPERFMRDFGAVPSLVLEAFDKDADIIVRQATDRDAPIDEIGRLADWFKCVDDKQRYIHIDLGLKKDFCGFCMGHNAGNIQIGEESLPVIYIDLVYGFKPPPGGEIQFSDVRQLVYDLQDRGFEIAKLSLDQWQSISLIQTFQERGIEAEVQSVDRNVKAYETFKEALHQKRFDCYAYKPLHKEYKRLELVRGKKIDHPAGGSKDITDSVAGTCYLISEAHEVEPYIHVF